MTLNYKIQLKQYNKMKANKIFIDKWNGYGFV